MRPKGTTELLRLAEFRRIRALTDNQRERELLMGRVESRRLSPRARRFSPKVRKVQTSFYLRASSERSYALKVAPWKIRTKTKKTAFPNV
jgi:hypothetical protein